MADARSQHHELTAHEVTVLLGVDPTTGLSQAEVHERRMRFGRNVLPQPRRRGPILRFVRQFHNPLVYVLLIAAAVTVVIGHGVDAVVILVVVLVNAVIGFIQEERADRALESLAEQVRTSSSVLRSGTVSMVDSVELVPGDILRLEAGDRVAADIRLLEVTGLRADESALTGESAPVDKMTGLLPAQTVLGDRGNMAYAGTLIVGGSATGIVVGTGAETELGRIHSLVGMAEGVQTPLTRKLTRFSRWLTVLIVVLALATFAIGLVRGESASEMLLAAVALAVSAIPEGLPAAVTITLAIGVSRMARRHAIIRHLPAAETLGSTTVICTDKTGTLTMNRMTVRLVHADGETRSLDDADTAAMRECLYAGLRCNDAVVEEGSTAGDPTEVALVSAARERGVVAAAGTTRVAEVPFTSESRLMAVLDSDAQGVQTVWIKGALERVLDLCDAADRHDIESAASDMGRHALRVLAFARAEPPVDGDLTEGSLASMPCTFVGLQAMEDPPRPEAVAAVAACRSAGIEVFMITGDHAETARSIAEQIGIVADGSDAVLTGHQMEVMDDDALGEALTTARVLARVSPEQKLRVVELLQHQRHIVAMTGDGVNDAPALKQADIGIAMGDMGTEVAKEASAMVLTDDNFATIESAVEEGRGVFDNLTKFIIWTLPTSLGEALVILSAIVVGTILPVLPVQILWINMTTAVALGLMLAFEPGEPGIMTRPPRRPDQPIMTASVVRRIITVGALMMIGAFGAFQVSRSMGLSLEESRTVVVSAFVAMEIGYLFNCRALDRSVLTVGLFSNRPLLWGVATMIALQLLFVYAPFMNGIFTTSPLSLMAWVGIIALGVAVFLLVGLEKWVAAQLSRGQAARARPAGRATPA